MKKITLFLSLLLFLNIFLKGQSIVVTTPQFRSVVLEEFTGIKCQYCPSGHAISQSIADAHPGQVVLVNVHQGSYAVPSTGQPDFRTAFGDALASNSGVSGYPAGTVNRQMFPDIEPIMAMGRGSWQAASERVLQEQSPVNVGFTSTFDTITRLLTVNVELYYTQSSTASTNFIDVALLQNHVYGYQIEYTTSGTVTHTNYDHKHILRNFLTGQWGDTVYNTTQGTLIQKTYTYTVPTTYINTNCDITNCDIAVYVSKTQNDIYTGGVAPVGNAFDGNSALYTGNFNAPVNDVIHGTNAITSSIPFTAYNALNGTEDFTFTLTTNAPVDWSGSFNINGTDYTNSATVSIINGTPASIVLNVVPGTSPSVSKYTLTMTSVSNPNATSHVIELYVISGVTDLVVNGGGSWGDGGTYNWESIYTDGLNFAGNTTYSAVSANVFQKAATNNALTGIGHVYMNVGWTFPSFSDEVATALMNFMDNGGNMMVCGQDIGWDIKSGSGYGTTVTNNLFTNYMHAIYNADGGTANSSLNPIVSDGIFGTLTNSPIVDVYNGNFYPDQINVTGGSVLTFKYGTSANNGGIRFINGTYKMVYIAPGMEQLSNIAVKNQIIKQTHDWFHGIINNVNTNAEASDIIVYPNPTSESIFVDAFVYNTTQINIEITDLSGKIVLKCNNVSNNHPINVRNLNNGFYFVKVISKNENSVHKIQIIK